MDEIAFPAFGRIGSDAALALAIHRITVEVVRACLVLREVPARGIESFRSYVENDFHIAHSLTILLNRTT